MGGRGLIVEAGVVLSLLGPLMAVVRLRHGDAWRQVAISTGLFVFVVLQLTLGLAMIDYTWPITGYPMYAGKPGTDPVVTEGLLFWGTTPDGRERSLPDWAFYPDPNDLPSRALPGLQDPATRDHIARALLRYYNAGQADPSQRITALRIETQTQQWSGDRTLLSSTVEPLAEVRG